jgi:hypothetical protein
MSIWMPNTLLSVYAKERMATELGFGLFLVFFPALEMPVEGITQGPF